MTDQAQDPLSDFAARAESLLESAARGLLDSPLLGTTLGRALAARARATQAQEAAIGLLGVPSAGDVDRLTRRVRQLSDRLATVEDSLGRIEGGLRRQADQLDRRLAHIERQLSTATRVLDDLEASLPEEPVAVSRDQPTLR
jgi:uncharacterized coiled-coil protein SlyX